MKITFQLHPRLGMSCHDKLRFTQGVPRNTSDPDHPLILGRQPTIAGGFNYRVWPNVTHLPR